MPDMTELQERRDFRKAVLSRLRKAYIKLAESGVKSYMIDDRQLTRLDLPELKKQIKELEDEIDTLDAQINGQRSRKAFAVVPRDW